jgi:hypothetical protein
MAATSSDAAFSVISARSASPVHLLPLNAAGTYFWLGGNEKGGELHFQEGK